MLDGVIPLETFPLVEWHYGELADVPRFTVLKTQICVTRPQCVNTCLSKMRRLFSSFAVTVQVSDAYVTTGLIIVLYIFILVFFFKGFEFISFELA